MSENSLFLQPFSRLSRLAGTGGLVTSDARPASELAWDWSSRRCRLRDDSTPSFSRSKPQHLPGERLRAKCVHCFFRPLAQTHLKHGGTASSTISTIFCSLSDSQRLHFCRWLPPPIDEVKSMRNSG